jgi:hypothetical protein
MNGSEFFATSRAAEPLHRSFPSSKRQVRFVIRKDWASRLPASTKFYLTVPLRPQPIHDVGVIS